MYRFENLLESKFTREARHHEEIIQISQGYPTEPTCLIKSETLTPLLTKTEQGCPKKNPNQQQHKKTSHYTH